MLISTIKKKQESDFKQTSIVVPFSPRFTYALSKKYDGVQPNADGSINQGTYYYMPFKILQQYGVCTEAKFVTDVSLPYSQFIDTNQISTDAYQEALQYKIKGYAEVGRDIDSLQQAIIQSDGVVLGLQVGKEWYTDVNGTPSWNAKDLFPLRPPQKILSGHAVYCYGWDTDANGNIRFWILNSWSDKWGINGTGYFVYKDYQPFIQEAMTMADVPDAWITALKQMPPASEFKHNFVTNLQFGQTNPEVMQLQIALKIDGEFPKTLKETSYYGSITQTAVMVFQQKYGIQNSGTNGTIVGPLTRNQLNKLFNK